MNRKQLILAATAAPMFLFSSTRVFAVTTPVLRSAQGYAVLGHTAVTNTGPTVVFGSATTLANVGVSEAGANAISGFSIADNSFVGSGTFTDGPGIVNAPAAIHGGDGPGPGSALNARNDLITAYSALASYGTADDLTGHDLGTSGLLPLGTLSPGVYSFATTAQLNGTLQLDAGGLDGAVWVFQIGTDLTTASASAVQLINPGGNLGADVGVFWVLGTSNTPGLGSATLGTTTAFEGNILALTSITLNTGATIYNGRALARNGAVTLDTNVISNICPDFDDLPFNVFGPGSTSPNSGPGFSSGLGFDTVTGELVEIGADAGTGTGGGTGGGVADAAIPEPGTHLLAGLGLMGLLVSLFRRSARRPHVQPACA